MFRGDTPPWIRNRVETPRRTEPVMLAHKARGRQEKPVARGGIPCIIRLAEAGAAVEDEPTPPHRALYISFIDH